MTTESLIKSILNVRCREGATIAEIQGKPWNQHQSKTEVYCSRILN